MLSNNGLIFKIHPFQIGLEFTPTEPTFLNVKQVLSLNVARPKITKRRSKKVPVSVVESELKSPVGRGLVGGALFGPAGFFLGAASGLSTRTSTTIADRTVYEEYETLGDPQLIIGTTLPDKPVFKIRFDPAGIADEWMFRIRGAQARR